MNKNWQIKKNHQIEKKKNWKWGKIGNGEKLGKLKYENENGEKIWKIGTIVEKSTKLKIEQNWKKWKWGQKLENWTKS